MRLLPVVVAVMVLLSCKENKSGSANNADAASDKQLLMGRWLMDSLDLSAIKDSNELDIDPLYLLTENRFKSIQFIFYQGGMMEVNEGDSMRFPTELREDSIILLAQGGNEAFVIKKIDSTNLVLLTEDTLLYRFKRIKEK